LGTALDTKNVAHDLTSLTAYLAERGTKEVDHGGVDFLFHLEGVYHYLERWGCAEHVRLAGLFHSVYGTEAFQDFALPQNSRKEVRRLIGEAAERLVYIVHAVAGDSFRESVLGEFKPRLRERFTGSPLPVTDQEFEDLLWVKLANTLEQAGRLIGDKKRRLGILMRAPIWLSVAEHLGGSAAEECLRIYTQRQDV
jgi:hypothetical protein